MEYNYNYVERLKDFKLIQQKQSNKFNVNKKTTSILLIKINCDNASIRDFFFDEIHLILQSNSSQFVLNFERNHDYLYIIYTASSSKIDNEYIYRTFYINNLFRFLKLKYPEEKNFRMMMILDSYLYYIFENNDSLKNKLLELNLIVDTTIGKINDTFLINHTILNYFLIENQEFKKEWFIELELDLCKKFYSTDIFMTNFEDWYLKK